MDPPPKRARILISLLSLPDEILMEVLLRIPLHELYWNIVLTCRRFHRLVMLNPVFTDFISKHYTNRFPDSGLSQTSDPGEFVECVKTLFHSLFDKKSPSFDFILARLHDRYPDSPNPMSHTALIKFWMGGPDPIDYVYFFPNRDSAGRPFWHYVSVGMSQSHDKYHVAFPYEFSFRMYDDAAASTARHVLAPVWPVLLMQALARYNFRYKTPFGIGDYTTSPIQKYQSAPSILESVAFRLDSQLGSLKVYALPEIFFLEMVCLTRDEVTACKIWRTSEAVTVLFGEEPVVTDVSRACRLSGAEGRRRKERVLEGVRTRGSWCEYLPFFSTHARLEVEVRESQGRGQGRSQGQNQIGGILKISMTKDHFEEFAEVLSGRIRFHRDLTIGIIKTRSCEKLGSVLFRPFHEEAGEARFAIVKADCKAKPMRCFCRANAELAKKLVELSREAVRLASLSDVESKDVLTRLNLSSADSRIVVAISHGPLEDPDDG